jgi:hypothetical protein
MLLTNVLTVQTFRSQMRRRTETISRWDDDSALRGNLFILVVYFAVKGGYISAYDFKSFV